MRQMMLLFFVFIPSVLSANIPLDRDQENEYKKVVRYLDKFLVKQKLTPSSVIALVRPLQILDIEGSHIRRSELSNFKNFNYGLMASVFKVPKKMIKRLSEMAVCPDDNCHERRANKVREILPLVGHVNSILESMSLNKVAVLGENIFRLNNNYIISSMLMCFEPTPIAGFIPSYLATHYDTIDESPQELKDQIDGSLGLRQLMLENGIIAIVKESAAINFIMAGIADNRYGLVVSDKPVKLSESRRLSVFGLEANKFIKLSEYSFYYQTE